MALEQAGVELIAKNFNKYIKQLDTIDKTQQEVFTSQSTGLDKSFNSATKAADKYDNGLKQVNKTQKKTQASQKQSTQSLLSFTASVKAFATGAAVQFTVESARLAGQFQSQQTGLNNLAASFGQSGSEIQASIQQASRGTISGLQAIQSANQALLLGVAQTPEEFDNLTRTALTLGRTMGLTATRSIENFTTALGRRSLLILDNFGISAKAVNAEVERIAQVDFGKANSQLSEAQKNAVFMEAALKIAGDAAAAIGEEAGEAAASFERFAAISEDLQVTFGEAVRPTISGVIDLLSRAGQTAQQVLAFISAGAAGIGSIISGVFDQLEKDSLRLINNVQAIFSGELSIGSILSKGFGGAEQNVKLFSDILDEASRAAEERFKQVASTIAGVSFPGDEIRQTVDALDESTEATKENEEQVKALGDALKQAENLALSFARAQEDAARKATREVIKLDQKQVKDREKLLAKQIKEFDTFEKDRLKQIIKTRQEGTRQQLQEQRKLQRQLKQEQDRFNLSQIQSERQFQLQETRLRAEGDILALQRLREDKDLQQLEEQENFDLSQRQAKEDGREQQKIQRENLDRQLRELQTDLEDQRAELLAGFDQQLIELQTSQQEQREQLRLNLAEQEADRQLSQQRQLEDLGRSFANQETITEEGTAAIANELENVFGIDGAASNIIQGFTAQTESEFISLFDRLEQIVAEADLSIQSTGSTTTRGGRGSRGRGRFTVPGFQEGGIVPGPVGQPQLAVVHGGETVIPAQQTIAAPVIPSQNLNVEMSGGFNITGAEGAGQATVEAAVTEMTDVMEIAIRRLTRRGGANG